MNPSVVALDARPGDLPATPAIPLDRYRLAQGTALPLFPELPEAAEYPVELLGPVLAPAAEAIARRVQVPLAMAAQSVLNTAAFATQALADVETIGGQFKPLSVFALTIAASGDRKTTCDSEAARAVETRQRALAERYAEERQAWLADRAAWDAEKKQIEGGGKKGERRERAAIRAELDRLGPEPLPPLSPMLRSDDITTEGLAKRWINFPASIWLSTTEGGTFTGGHAMAKEHKLKSAGDLSKLWDGTPIGRVRAGDEAHPLYGRRLSLHLQIQPDAAAAFLSDGVLKDQGLLSRVLVAFPSTLMGTRLFSQPDPSDLRKIAGFEDAMLRLLERPWPLRDGRNELEPARLYLSEGAKRACASFADHMERQMGPDGDLLPVCDFASKAAEHAGRIAGIQTVVSNPEARAVDQEVMERAAKLVGWYVNEALRLHRAARINPDLLLARMLLDWLRDPKRGGIAKMSDLMNAGPSKLRLAERARTAARVLLDHHWLDPDTYAARPCILMLTEAGDSRTTVAAAGPKPFQKWGL